MEESRYDRQILAFGDEGQQKISKTCIGVVGLGGTGSHIAQSLAYLGVENYILVDDDRVELTNLNRLVGAFPSDIAAGVLKVDAAKRMIQMIKPEAHVIATPRNLRSHEAIDRLTTCTLIFGCVDHDAPRLILTELCSAYEIILIDCASEIIIEDNTVQEFGGRVVVAQPGDFCLCCANQVDMNIAREELESRETKELRKQHGYGLGEQMKAPAIISVNGVVANLAVTGVTPID